MLSQEVIKQFCDNCYFVYKLHEEYFFLYESNNKNRTELLNKTARDFFLNNRRILKERIFLEICKITDPPGCDKKSNFTIKYILNKIDKKIKDKFGLENLSEEIHEFRKYIIAARNKILSHSDFETVTSQKILGVFPKEEDDKFWRSLQEFVNKIHIHYCKSPFVFDDIVDCTYNAKDLILALKKAAYFDHHFRSVLHSELLEDDGFKYRNA